MDNGIREVFRDLQSGDDKVRYKAFKTALSATDEEVPWAAEVWDDLVKGLSAEKSYCRAAAGIVLCNLAKSDKGHRLEKSIDRLLELTRDEKLTTRRPCLQSMWKPALVSKKIEKKVVACLAQQYEECSNEDHYNLIRQDILQSLRNIYEQTKDEGLKKKCVDLVGKEENPRYRKTYEKVLSAVRPV